MISIELPFAKFGRLTVSPLGKCMHVWKNILDLDLGVTNILFQKIHRMFRFQRMKSIETPGFVLHSSLELLQSIVGRLHLSVHFLC